MSGGELFDRIVAKAYYNEKEARDVCKILLEAVGFCHANSVAHRDLKPENLLLLSPDDDSAVKIADFGFAAPVEGRDGSGYLKTKLGTMNYMAPEIHLKQPYMGKQVDLFASAIILFIMVA
jgi:serine/threonine protein kinase